MNFLGNISVRGLGTDATLEYQSSSAYLAWNYDWAYDDGTSYDFTMNNAFEYCFTPSGFTPAVGDFVLLWSNDEISDVVTHVRNGSQSPGELHEVYHWDAANTRAYVRDYIVDYMSTSPKVTAVPMYTGVRVDNLRFAMKSGVDSGDYDRYIYMKTCHGAVITQCHFDRGMGAVLLVASADIDISNCVLEGMNTEAPDYDDVLYGILVAVTNNVKISDCTITGYRHGVDTSAGWASGDTRWGTPLHTTIQGCTVTAVTEFDPVAGTAAHHAIHTHAEGYDFVVRDCDINIMGNAANHGVEGSCRAVQVLNNRFIGGHDSSGLSSAIGVSIYSRDCEVSGNTFRRLLYGVRTNETPDFYNLCNNFIVDDNRFIDIRSVPIRLGAGDDQSCTNNRFRNSAWETVTTPQHTQAHIQFGSIKQYSCTFEDAGTTLTLTPSDGNPWSFSRGADYYEGQEIFFTGGSVPSPLTVDTIYYVKTIASNTTGTISATRGGAAITFAAGGGSGTAHLGNMTGSGNRVAGNISFMESNDHFVETQNMDTDDVQFAGNTVVGYGGASFSDRYSKDDDFQNEYSSLNTGM
jgi:hypothetical protein